MLSLTFYSWGEDKRLESPSMYLSSKETRVAGSLLLKNLGKARSIILLAISSSFVNNYSAIVQTKTANELSDYIRRQCQRLKFSQGGLA